MIRALKITGWLAMAALAMFVTVVSARYFTLSPSAAIGPPLAEKFNLHITPLLLHVGGSIVALTLGPWAFWGTFRNKYLRLHRWLGRIYLSAVLVGGLAGFYMALTAFGGLPTRFGFSLLAIMWLMTGTMAYLRIRQGQVELHREWMIRNYALTFAAVMLRLWLPLFLSLGHSFPESYATVAWLSWVPNLLAAQLIIGRGKVGTGKRRLIEAS